MKIIFELTHPAHFHHFKHTINALSKMGNEVKIIISKKDILVDLLESNKISYTVIGENKHSIFLKILEHIRKYKKINKVIKDFKPDLIVCRPSQNMTFLSYINNIHCIVFAEDDLKVALINGLLSLPFARTILTPIETDLRFFSKNQFTYNGYQKLAYLHPNYFNPNIEMVKKYFDLSKPFFIIRLSRLSASHDILMKGISDKILNKIIMLLSKKGEVVISSEREVNPIFSKYMQPFPVDEIHHFMYYASMFIGDSQSMAFESAMLGTASIRFSSFSGRINALEKLEKKYRLTFGINPINEEDLYKKIKYILDLPDASKVFKKRREKLLKEKIDVTAMMTSFIHNYPRSRSQVLKTFNKKNKIK